jgi:hypothetical protein
MALMKNILEGASSIMDMYRVETEKSTLSKRYIQNRPSDLQEIYSDWEVTGQDIIVSSKKIANAR